jgi:hypothetical protein
MVASRHGPVNAFRRQSSGRDISIAVPLLREPRLIVTNPFSPATPSPVQLAQISKLDSRQTRSYPETAFREIRGDAREADQLRSGREGASRFIGDSLSSSASRASHYGLKSPGKTRNPGSFFGSYFREARSRTFPSWITVSILRVSLMCSAGFPATIRSIARRPA